MAVQLLIDKKIQYNKLTKGEYDGYRIKLYFGTDRKKAEKIKSEFVVKYAEYPVYEDYIQPNFTLVIGNFKTKIDAHDVLKKLQPDYPNAFIIKTKIQSFK